MEFKPTIPLGGLFHNRQVEYSPETAAFLKELIRESKLSIYQRKQLNDSIKKGEPLPLPPNKTNRRKHSVPEPEENIKNILIPRRRKQETISQSGAYDRDKFVPCYLKANHDIEKKRLQDLMAFGKVVPQTKTKQEINQSLLEKKKMKEKEITKEKLFLTALEEIKERNEFLKKMEAMGKGKEYKAIIEQQIWEKLRLLEKIDKDLFSTVHKYLKNTSQVGSLFTE